MMYYTAFPLWEMPYFFIVAIWQMVRLSRNVIVSVRTL